MSDHRVCLSFDFDAWSGMVARGMTTPTPVSRGEFGVMATDRILRLLARRNIASSWYVPGVVAAAYPDHIRRIAAEGHEIGNHGWTHVPPANLSPEDERAGLIRANETLDALTGRTPAGYRSPSWDLSPVTVDLLLEQGFLYDSSMMGDDHTPYYARRGDVVPDDAPVIFGEETALVEMPISWSLDDFPHFEFLRGAGGILPGLASARGVEDNWVDDFAWMVRTTQSGVLTYTFHPFVIGRGHRMMLLERLIDRLRDHGAVFCTLESAARDFRDGRAEFGRLRD